MMTVGRECNPSSVRRIALLYVRYNIKICFIFKKKVLTAHGRRSPSDRNAVSGTDMRICSNGRAKAFTVSSLVAGTRIVYATFHKCVHGYFIVARLEYFRFQNSTLPLSPNLALGMRLTSVNLFRRFYKGNQVK